MLAYYGDLPGGVQQSFTRLIPSELGFKLRYHPYEDYPYIHEFFQKADAAALTRGIEFLYILLKRYSDRSAVTWRLTVQRVFEEERLAYSIDEQGRVHSTLDVSFDQARTDILAGLAGDNHRAIRAEVQKAFEALAPAQPDTKAAVRAMFDAVEGYVKLQPKGDKVAALGPEHVESVLRPLVEQALAGDDTARASANQYLTGLKSWINACQPYRHAQGVTEPNPPPRPLATGLVTTGAAYLRWLVATLRR